MNIIKVPSVYSCKLPGGEWINLASVRHLQFEDKPVPVVILTWNNGDKTFFSHEKAIAIKQAWEEAHKKYSQESEP